MGKCSTSPLWISENNIFLQSSATSLTGEAAGALAAMRTSMPIKPENKKRYPRDWPEIRERILLRARNKCEFCGVRNNRLHPITDSRVVLTIAHLDHTPENCDPKNLRALCQRCHNRYDAEHRAVTRKQTRESNLNTNQGQLFQEKNNAKG